MNHENEKIGNRNLKIFCLGAALNDVGEEMYTKFLPYYALIFLGVTPFQYGLIEGLGDGINRILKLFTGYFTDKVGRKVPVILSYILMSLARLGLPLVKGWAGFIPFRGLRQVGRAVRDPATEASIAESFPPAKRGRAFGLLNMWDRLSGCLYCILLPPLWLERLHQSRLPRIFGWDLRPSFPGNHISGFFYGPGCRRLSAPGLPISFCLNPEPQHHYLLKPTSQNNLVFPSQLLLLL